MDDTCSKWQRTGARCVIGQILSSEPARAPLDKSFPATRQNGIAFGEEACPIEPALWPAPGPRFDVPGPMMHTRRDPALSLVAMSGVDPAESVMVEVAPVMPDTLVLQTHALVGWRVGFADRYVWGEAAPFPEHSSYFFQALETLRLAGAQLVPVPARAVEPGFHFTLDTRNEIDERVTEHRLDALVADAQCPAFHAACKPGNGALCVSTVEGTTIWFYSSRWAQDSLGVLVQVYQQAATARAD
ncbi:MAG: hypothetical protein GAK37_01032 [Pseudomonas sp.]|nr:MAG: hypothetical protein GAK37_01032 [Pseudomonas sp.]